MVNLDIPLRKRLENRKADKGYLNNVDGPGMGWDGEDERHRVKVYYAGSDKWYAKHWRNVQYCDEVKDSPVDHTGWFTDEDQNGKVRGIVVQLPARNGEEQWLAGYEDDAGNNVFHLDTIFDEADEAARAADGIAENLAEREREYNAKSTEKYNRVEKEGEVAEHLESIKALVPVRNAPMPMPAHDAVRESIRSHIADVRKLRKAIEKSISEWGEMEDVEV